MIIRTLFIFFAASLFCSQNTYAQSFRIGVEDIQYYPFYSTNDGVYSGYAGELFTLFRDHTKLDITVHPTPVNRLFSDFLKGEVDFKYPDNPFWGFKKERTALQIVYSAPVNEYIDGCMVLPHNMGKSIEAIKVIGTVRGFTPFDYLDEIKSGKITLWENRILEGLLRQVMRNRVDCAYVNIAVARHLLQSVIGDSQALVFDPNLPHTRSSYLLSTWEHPKIIDQFNQFLIERQADILLLHEKYNIDIE